MADQHEKKPDFLRYPRMAWLVALYGLDRFVDWLLARLLVMRRESDLFLGLAFTSIAILGFRAGRYCDGNTADYLSCTRPAVFYYYPAATVALFVVGIFLIALSRLSRRG